MAYIDREIFINNELIPLVKRLDLCHPKQKKGVLMAIQKLNEEPTADVVEVVRCKDCEYFSQKENAIPVCKYLSKPTGLDGYCQWGAYLRNTTPATYGECTPIAVNGFGGD